MPTKSMIQRTCEQCGQPFFAQPNRVAKGKARSCSVQCAGIAKRIDAQERFWKYVQKGPGAGDCWLWAGGKVPSGYGMFRDTGYSQIRAHRYSLQIHLGRPISKGLDVLHSCPGGDNPACVRPEHLREGTQQDNSHDAVERGQMARGDRNGSRLYPERLKRGHENGSRLYPERLKRGTQSNKAKLNDHLVVEIRQLRSEGWHLKKLGQRYGVSFSTIHKIVTNQSWKHVA